MYYCFQTRLDQHYLLRWGHKYIYIYFLIFVSILVGQDLPEYQYLSANTMIKGYKKGKVLESPSEQCYLYEVTGADKETYYMYEVSPSDSYETVLRLYTKFANPNILNLVDVIKTDTERYYVVEKPIPTLLKHQSLEENHCLKPDEALSITSQILNAIFAIHKQGYLYLNVRPDAIKYENKVAKLTDFSNFERIAKKGPARTRQQHILADRFVPPEVYKGHGVTTKSDYWMLGITLYFMLNAEYPFTGEDILAAIKSKCEDGFDFAKQVASSKRKNIHIVTPELCDFFKKIFAIEPDERITEKQLMNFGQLGKHFTEQALSYIKEDHGQKSYLRTKINLKAGPQRQARKELQVLGLLDKMAAYMFINTTDILEQKYRLATRYAILKIAMLRMSELQRLLAGKTFDPYRISNEYVDIKQKLGSVRKIVEMQFQTVEEELKSSENKIAESVKIILGAMFTISKPKNFNQIKMQVYIFNRSLPYRKLTSTLFSMKSQFPKGTSSKKGISLLSRVIVLHLINRVFETDQIDENIAEFAEWDANRKNESGRDMENMNEWFNEESEAKLRHFINRLTSKYLDMGS